MPSIEINIPLLRSLLSLVSVIEAKDPYTGGHTWRVSRYARQLAEKAGLSADEVFITHLGSLMHDIGKVGVSDAVLRKPGKLTEDEFAVIKKHPLVGQALLSDHPLAELLTQTVIQHHERFDGKGYPSGLAGQDISVFGRIVAVADSFDAMTSARPYHQGMAPGLALDIIARGGGTQFDPALARAFAEMGGKGEFDHVLGHSAEERPMVTCPMCGPIVVVPKGAPGGMRVVCPVCTGNYLLEAKADTFEIEWLGTYDPARVPQPDTDTIDDFMRYVPAKLVI